MKKVTLLLASAVLSLGALAGFALFDGTPAKAADCSANAVITCGFTSISQLRAKYNADNPHGTQAIFSYFKMNSSVINSANYKTGYVTKSGNVVVGGKVVATDALTAGRQYMAGSTKRVVNGTTFYTRTPAVSFQSSQLSVIAFFDSQGRFIGASMFDCGNPVMATNKVTPPPAPVYSCDKLAATKISRTQYRFATAATAKNGATIKSYSYNFGDGTTQPGGASVDHTYAKAGTYTIKSTVTVSVNGKNVAVGNNCIVTVTVAQEMCPIPGKTQYPKDDVRCVEDKPSVSIEKTVNGGEHATVALNTPFTYEITVKNTGNVTLKNAVVSDKAPADVSFIASSIGTIKNNEWSYTIAELGTGQSRQFTITAKLTAFQEGNITNTACVETPTVPGSNPDDCDTATIDTTRTIQVCDTSSNTVITINESEFDESHMTKDLTQCQTVVTPPELPHTGIGDALTGSLGMGGIAGALYHYGSSRRQLRKAMLRQ